MEDTAKNSKNARPWLHSEEQPLKDVVKHVPEVPNEVRPYIGQRFDSPKEAEIFYRKYASIVGFDVRICHHVKHRDGPKTYRQVFCCSREGSRRNNEPIDTQRKRGLTRLGCKARIAIVDKKGWYEITKFDEEHNHIPTTPTRKFLKKQNRKVTSAAKDLSATLSMANVPVHQQMAILGIQSGGLENVGFLQQDLYNHERDIRKFIMGHDADILIDYFNGEQESNASFFYSIEKSGNNLYHCFWADVVSRRAYGLFGDVIIFDTTFNTNRYSMILAPLLGVNNHGQTIVFGCAFLSNESADSFVWLFEEFKKAMPGAAPRMIITDQDLGMTKAIATSFPEAIHRFCSWHIQNKFPEKFGNEMYKTWGDSFKDIIWNSFDKEEFEERWIEVVGASGLDENEWLQGLFEIRDQWIPVYVNHVFSAGMTSSQRAESAHAFFKRFVNSKNTLNDFVTCFNRGLSQQRLQNLKAGHLDIEQRPLLHYHGVY